MKNKDSDSKTLFKNRPPISTDECRDYLKTHPYEAFCHVCKMDMTKDEEPLIWIGGMTQLVFHSKCYTSI